MSSNRPGWAEKMIADSLNNPSPLLLELDTENDEISVRERLSAGKYNTWQSGVVNEWLRRKSDEHRDRREEETLSLAKEANRLAFEANSIARLEAASAARSSRYAMYAAIIAVVAIVIDNKEDIFKFFSF